MTDFTKVKKGDTIKVCWKGSKGYKLSTVGKIDEVTENKVIVGMVVDTYRLFPFNAQGHSLGIHEHWLEI